MAKQSVRKGKNRFTGKDVYYQPKKFKTRKDSYLFQIQAQLPKGFQMFTKIVYIDALEIMFEPLAKHKKVKKTMKHFKEGGIIEKTTLPDMMDNLNKLLFDCMSGIVYKDDGLICRASNISKVYGSKGQITITITGE